MNGVLLAPHNDDEALFASFTILRHRPAVVNVFDCGRDRAGETARALEILGCDDHRQWHYPEYRPDWKAVGRSIAGLASTFDVVYAPMPHYADNWWDGDPPPPAGCGVCQHDAVGQLALDAFGADRFVNYETYTREHGRTVTDNEVVPEPGWIGRKLRALACYETQLGQAHFLASLREYRA